MFSGLLPPVRTCIAFLLAVSAFLSPAPAQIPDGITFKAAFGTDEANQFSNPVLMLEIPGKPGFFLVPEMVSGKIWVLSPGASGHTKSQFGTVTVNSGERDMGLVGFAFHPDYANNRKYYVKYGNPQRPPRQLCFDERTAAADLLKDSGQPGRRLLTIALPTEFSDHNGGSPAFGPDGFLYIPLGDGGWDLTTPDKYKHGQNKESLLGKILRIDVNVADTGLEYAIPKENPFVSDPNAKVRREIWAYGLRNPYRISFDRLSGELYAGDVGWNKYDEVNVIKKGGNYGWSLKESPYCLIPGTCDGVAIEDPVAFMANGAGPGMAKCVIGGHVYRGDPASPFYGVYLFGDHTIRKLFAIKKAATGQATVKEYPLTTPQEPIAFTLDANNNVYMVGWTGTVYKLEHPDLKPVASSARPSLAASRAKAMRSLVLLAGDAGVLRLPVGLKGRYEAVTPTGVRLGVLSSGDGSTQVTELRLDGDVVANGLVILRPL
ncbi:MAG: PQQ-dependent sugar dehydrogenase [Fibrobacterota bacterium]|nr:PQQ-dependent sugar dehydrogenase [Fibrobacterota bacterium]